MVVVSWNKSEFYHFSFLLLKIYGNSQEEQLLGCDFWIFRTPKYCWVRLDVFEHLPILADKEFSLIVLKQCGTKQFAG